MAIRQLELPIFKYSDPATGLPLSGGLVYTYAAGTTNLVNTYEASGGSVNSNPVVLDSHGEAKIWFDQSLRVVVKSADDLTTYFTEDNISEVGGESVVYGDYNLVHNGSFESTDGDGTPSQWTVALNDPSASILTGTSNVVNGKQSCIFTGFSGSGAGSITSPLFNVSASETIGVSLSYMVSSATTENTALIKWYKKDDTASSTPSTTLTLPSSGAHPTSMTTYRFTVSVPGDATRATIFLDMVASSSTTTDAVAEVDNVLVYDTYGVTASVDELNYNDITTLGTVQANKTVTADANGNINNDTSTASKYLNFDTSTNKASVFGDATGLVGMYDFTNSAYIYSYTPHATPANRLLTLEPPVTVTTLTVTGTLTGDLTGNADTATTATTATTAGSATTATSAANLTGANIEGDVTNSGNTFTIGAGKVLTAMLESDEQMTTANVGGATAGLAVGAVGSYAWLKNSATNITITQGDTISGSLLDYAGVAIEGAATANTSDLSGTSPSGAWMAMGACTAVSNDKYSSTLFLRIS